MACVGSAHSAQSSQKMESGKAWDMRVTTGKNCLVSLPTLELKSSDVISKGTWAWVTNVAVIPRWTIKVMCSLHVTHSGRGDLVSNTDRRPSKQWSRDWVYNFPPNRCCWERLAIGLACFQCWVTQRTASMDSLITKNVSGMHGAREQPAVNWLPWDHCPKHLLSVCYDLGTRPVCLSTHRQDTTQQGSYQRPKCNSLKYKKVSIQ